VSPKNTRVLLVAVPLSVALAGIAVGAAHYGSFNRPAGTADYGDRVGRPAPRITLATTAGSFDSARVAGPIVLEIFATWCGHCKTETADLNRLYARYGKRMTFVAVNGSKFGIDGTSPESRSDLRAFARGFHVRYPVSFDPRLEAFKAFEIKTYPTTVLITSDRKIAFMAGGEWPAAELAPHLDALH
jgi:cytochrome c biogenesis protein CcmG/thiol:disulfide interchange protein DsbE